MLFLIVNFLILKLTDIVHQWSYNNNQQLKTTYEKSGKNLLREDCNIAINYYGSGLIKACVYTL